MSRGGIGKSKKQPPPPPPKRRGWAARAQESRTRESRARVRSEPKPRPGLASGFGAILLGLSTLLIFAGLLLASEDEPGAGWTLVWGFSTLPLGFLTVAMLSMPRRLTELLRPTFMALSVDVGATTALLVLFQFLGGGAPAAMTAGVGLGAMLVFSQPEESSRRVRLRAVGIMTVAMLAIELFGLAIVALIGPFLVLPAINYADNRAIMKVDSDS